MCSICSEHVYEFITKYKEERRKETKKLMWNTLEEIL